MEAVRIETGAVLAHTGVLLRRAPALALSALALLAGLGTLTDVLSDQGGQSFTVAVSLLSLMFQLLITRRLLDSLHLRGSGTGGGFWQMFGLAFLSGLAILLGLVLLVVPGIVLMARWALAVPILVAGDVGPVDALRRSWAATADNFGPVLAALVIIYLPGLALLAAAMLLLPPELAESLPLLVLLNLVMEGIFIIGWHLQVALFAASQAGVAREQAMADIFA